MSRSRAAIQTWLASLTFLVVTSFIGFFVTPKILAVLGPDRFGLVQALTQTLGYLTLVGQGIAVAMVPAVAAAMGRGDPPGVHRAMSVGFRAYATAAAGLTLLGLMLTPALSLLIRIPPADLPELRGAWLIALAGVPLMMFTPLKLLIDVDQKGYLAHLLMTAQGMLTAVASVVAVRSGWGVPGVMAASLAGSLFFYGAMTAITAVMYPGLAGSVRRARPSREDCAILALSGPTLVAMLSERIGLLSDSIVLSGVRGTAAATVLFMTQRLASLGHLLLQSINGAIWPALAEMHAKGDLAGLNRRLVEVTRLSVLLGVAVLAPIVAYNGHFVARWVGADLDGGRAVVVAASFNAIALCLVMIYTSTLVSTGQVRRLAGPAALSALVNLIASVLLARSFGPIGPLLGTTLATLAVYSWYLPLQLRRSFGTPPLGLLRAVAAPLAWGLAYGVLLALLADAHSPPGWFGLLGEMALGSIAFLGFGSAVILSDEDRALWKGRVITPLLNRWRSFCALWKARLITPLLNRWRS